MPHILLLRLSAPMQSWGVMSRFSRRDTGKEPSKSGVIGLLCAALGISRDEANAENPFFAELIKLKMGVRVVREGILQSDYHTAQNIAKADGGTKDTELSTRFYLADADFVVGLEGDDLEILEIVQKALKNPKWQLFLGRKAFVPDLPVYFSENENIFTVEKSVESLEKFLQGEKLNAVLQEFDTKFGRQHKKNAPRQRLIIEDEQGSETRQDVPLSFAARRFTNRRVRTEFINLKNGENNDGNLFDENDFESAIAEGLG
jgi:CRISPR system Cascade subunit CasD